MGTYIRIIDSKTPEGKEKGFFDDNNRYIACDDEFVSIPGAPYAYWASDSVKHLFSGESLADYSQPRVGCQTSDNNRFLRFWFEVERDKFKTDAASAKEAVDSGCKWFPYNKGGSFRRWYGNNELVINWEDDGKEVKEYATKLYKCSTRTVKNVQYYFREEVTWSSLSTGLFSARYCKPGFLFDTKGSACFFDANQSPKYCIGYLNSCVCQRMLEFLSPTLDYGVGSVAKLPYIENNDPEIEKMVDDSIDICKEEWDEFETSWDFGKHPLI